MGRMIAFFIFMFAIGAVLTGIMQGGGGISITALTSNISDSDTTIPVTSTKGYLGSSYIIIGNETIDYNSIDATNFKECTRGYGGTDAETHSVGAKAMTEGASVLNQPLGFDITKEAENWGPLSAITVPVRFLTTTLPKLFVTNWYFLKGDFIYFGLFFYAAAGGLIFSVSLAVFRGVG